MNNFILRRFYVLSLLFVFLLIGYGSEGSDLIIVGQYTERLSEVEPKVKQNLILTTGQEYYKVREPKEDAPPIVPGKYVSSFDPKNDLVYEIVLNSDGTASYEVSSLKVVHSIIEYG